MCQNRYCSCKNCNCVNCECNILTVTISQKTPKHPFYNQGSKLGFVINGIEGGTLHLQRNIDYLINYHSPRNSLLDHPLYFTTSSVGKGEGRLTTDILGASVINFDDSFPSRFYYQCANHPNMGGLIELYY